MQTRIKTMFITTFLSLIMGTNAYAVCTTSQSGNDFDVQHLYLKDGSVSLADIYSAKDLAELTRRIQTVKCEKTPIYVAIKGSPTAFYKFNDAIFEYKNIEAATGIESLMNTIRVNIFSEGTAQGAKIFDMYILDEKINSIDESWKGLYIISARAEKVEAGRVAANCALDIPATIHLPDTAPGKMVTANLPVKIKCDKKPNSFLSYRISPDAGSYNLANGVIYNEKNIKMSLFKNGSPFDLSKLISHDDIGGDLTIHDNYEIKSDVGQKAASGQYGTNLTIWLYHN